MKYFIESEPEITVAGTKKIYDIYEKERNYPISPKHHTHSYYELILVTKGDFIFQIELGNPTTLHTGDILFVPPFVPHATYRTSDATMRCTVVKFSPLYLYPSEVTPSDMNYLLVEPKYKQSYYLFRHDAEGTDELATLLTKTLYELTEQTIGYEIIMRAYLSAIYVWLLRNCDSETNQQLSIKLDSHTSKMLHHVLHFLVNNYQHKISMTELAEMCNMNYSLFSVFFKNATGKNFNEYLLDMRLNYAQKKLLAGEQSISEIASTCGFEYVSYFIRQFKAKYGVTPKQYQKMFRTASQMSNDKSEISENIKADS